MKDAGDGRAVLKKAAAAHLIFASEWARGGRSPPPRRNKSLAIIAFAKKRQIASPRALVAKREFLSLFFAPSKYSVV